MRNEEDFNKLSFRRLLLVMVFTSILISLIPNIFNFEKYYGLSRFVDQGVINAYLDNKFELYLVYQLTVWMLLLTLLKQLLVYR